MKSHRQNFASKLISLVIILVISSAGLINGQPKVSLAQARIRLNAYSTQIYERKKKMSDAYYWDGAVKTLQASFRAAGITSTMASADPWGRNGIGLTWAELGRQFYEFHAGAVEKSLDAIEARGSVRQDELDYLAAGMRSWQEVDQDLERHLHSYVELFTAEAKVYDEKQAYVDKTNEEYNQLTKQTPYPAGKIQALNERVASAVKVFDDRVKKLREQEDQVRKEIGALGGKQVFTPLTRVPKPPVTPPVSNAPPARPAPASDDPGLPLPIPKRCQQAHPNEMRQLESEVNERTRFLAAVEFASEQIRIRERQLGATKELEQQARAMAARKERNGDKQGAQKARQDVEGYLESEAKLNKQIEDYRQQARKANEQAENGSARIKELRTKILKDCVQ